ncbi:MAG: hypothetical protein KatS3mg102_1550 [Planctomycetota bacterium]|nr:MAG: hypothetical protein KatS3mg102_1550 [Planctomycetota bacterium]
MWPWVVRRLGAPLYDLLRFGGRLRRAYAELLATERASAAELARLRARRLARLLAHAAAHVPHYRQTFARAGVRSPAEAAALAFAPAAFARLPLLGREELRRQARALRARDGRRPVRRGRTSGSSGSPLTVWLDVRALARHRAAKLRARRWLGIAPGERWVMLWGRDEPRSPLYRTAVELAENRRVLRLQELEGERPEAALAKLARFAPALIYGFASGLVRLGELVAACGAPPLPALRAVISTAELLPATQRERLAAALGVPVAIEYGLTEVQFVAGSCEAAGLHVAEENVLLEVVRDGQPAPPGELGEIVLTDLHNHAAPLIRYATGDVGALRPEPCPCGRTLWRLDLQLGRTCELVEIGGRWLHPEVFTLPHDFPYYERVAKLRVLRTAERAFVLEVVPAGSGPFEPVARALARAVERALGLPVALEVRAVAALPREPSGKLRYYRDLRREPRPLVPAPGAAG